MGDEYRNNYIRLNEHLSELFSKSIQKFLVFQTFAFRIIRIIGSILLIPNFLILFYHSFFTNIILILSQYFSSILMIWWVYKDEKERRDKLDFFRLYVKMNDLIIDDFEMEQFKSITQPEWGESIQYIPAGILEIGRLVFDTNTWGLSFPCIYEGLSLTIFTLACILRLLLTFNLIPFLFLRITISILPFLLSVLHLFIVLFFKPCDILSAMKICDKVLVYNQHGLVLNNRSLEQYERDSDYGGSLAEKWEPCTYSNRAVVVFDQINDVTIAISQEEAPFSKNILNFPWIYIVSVNSIGREYRVILPIRLKIANSFQSSSFSKKILMILSRYWRYIMLPPIYDGLTVEESIRLIQVIQQRRPDLNNKLNNLIIDIQKNILYDGFTL